MIHSLLNGQINFAEFEFLAGNEEKVMVLCDVSESLAIKKTVIGEAFKARHKEREAFMSYHNALLDLWTYARKAVKQGWTFHYVV